MLHTFDKNVHSLLENEGVAIMLWAWTILRGFVTYTL